VGEDGVMQTWTTLPDKAAAWGEGPWVGEPDKAQWADEATGLPCLAKRACDGSGVWCGYVGVPSGHPLYGVDRHADAVRAAVDIPIELNYSDLCQEDERPIEHRVCHIPAPGEPDDVWWFGYDCGDWNDVSPGTNAMLREGGAPPELLQSIASRQMYWTLPAVQAVCADLARQLAAIDKACWAPGGPVVG
jgi:hypothetical protein